MNAQPNITPRVSALNPKACTQNGDIMCTQNGDIAGKTATEASILCTQNGDIPAEKFFEPRPSIDEAFDLIMLGVPYEAPSEVRLLLLWMLQIMESEGTDYCSCSVRQLAALMHQGRNTIQRSLRWARENQVCIGRSLRKEKTAEGVMTKQPTWDIDNTPSNQGRKMG